MTGDDRPLPQVSDARASDIRAFEPRALWKRARRCGLAALLALGALSSPIPAQQDMLNSLIHSENIGTGHSSPPTAEDKERWLASDNPLGALRIITVHPLPGESCQNVLFELRPSIRNRHEVGPGQTLKIDMDALCLLGVRNDSQDRSVAVRLGEQLRTVAIGIDSRLQSGMTIAPGHEVLTPIRPLLDELSFEVQTVWDDLIDSRDAEVSAFNIRITATDGR